MLAALETWNISPDNSLQGCDELPLLLWLATSQYSRWSAILLFDYLAIENPVAVVSAPTLAGMCLLPPHFLLG
jgi:hypothetical protein